MHQAPCSTKECLLLLRQTCDKKLLSITDKTGEDYTKFNAIYHIISDDRFMYMISQDTLLNIIKDLVPEICEQVYKQILKDMIL